MISVIKIIASCITIIIVFFVTDFFANRAQEKTASKIAEMREPFSVAKYMERIERENDKILREREYEKKYEITLWFGNDGCKLDENGDIVWMKKYEPNKQVNNPFQFCNTTNQISTQMDCMQAPESQIEELHRRLLAMSIQSNIHQQNEMILNALKPCSIPSYPLYSQPYSYSTLCQYNPYY